MNVLWKQKKAFMKDLLDAYGRFLKPATGQPLQPY